jgi:23S rRNA U2552 (ribose-2'-O)-methylase RlmE/FtsJ
MKLLKNIFDNLNKQSDKFEHYFPLYEKHFSKFIDRSPRILEIGIQKGGSCEMWANFFGKGTLIDGVDLKPRCKETDYLKIHTGDQGSKLFWDNFINTCSHKFDIIIDDGSHDNPHQILTLIKTYNLLNDGGIYWCEDTHTSYYENVRVVDGGYQNSKSFVEFTKKLIDVIHSEHTKYAIDVGPTPNSKQVDQELVNIFDKIQGIHFYDSIVVIDKGSRLKVERVIHK